MLNEIIAVFFEAFCIQTLLELIRAFQRVVKSVFSISTFSPFNISRSL